MCMMQDRQEIRRGAHTMQLLSVFCIYSVLSSSHLLLLLQDIISFLLIRTLVLYGLLLPDRYHKRKPAPLAGFAFNPYLTAMKVDQLFCQRKAEACAFIFFCQRHLKLGEFTKKPGDVLRFYSDAC